MICLHIWIDAAANGAVSTVQLRAAVPPAGTLLSSRRIPAPRIWALQVPRNSVFRKFVINSSYDGIMLGGFSAEISTARRHMPSALATQFGTPR